MLSRALWKPLLHRAVTGRWHPFRMVNVEPPLPQHLHRLGLYVHVPFCGNLCPFCPYNRHPYSDEAFARYELAIRQEIDLHADDLAESEVVSLYIGGGTPTVNLDGLLRILGHLASRFRHPSDICIELHPSSMDDACLARLRQAGVTMVSVGVESTSDRILQVLGRYHDGHAALNAARRAVAAGFETVNVDLMFALPTQSLDEWETDLQRILDTGAHQLSTYPLFAFPYSDLGKQRRIGAIERPPGRLIRAMLARTHELATDRGLERCAVWSWLRRPLKKFSSITRHHYVGFGPSAASMIGSHFYVNTFSVDAYASALPRRRPVALSLAVDRRLEMAYWLYWRVYELHVGEADFRDQFGADADLTRMFGHLFRPLMLAKLAERTPDGYRITNSGAYWIHRIQNEYRLNYINRLWGRCRDEPWPAQVTL